MQQHRAAEAIKDVERRLETSEKSRRERLQVQFLVVAELCLVLPPRGWHLLITQNQKTPPADVCARGFMTGMTLTQHFQ